MLINRLNQTINRVSISGRCIGLNEGPVIFCTTQQDLRLTGFLNRHTINQIRVESGYLAIAQVIWRDLEKISKTLVDLSDAVSIGEAYEHFLNVGRNVVPNLDLGLFVSALSPPLTRMTMRSIKVVETGRRRWSRKSSVFFETMFLRSSLTT